MTPTAGSMLSLPLVLPMPRIDSARAPRIRRGGGEAGRTLREVGDRQHPIAGKLVGTEHRNGDRHVLRALGAIARGDDDLSDAGLLGLRSGRCFLSVSGNRAQ